ncbi:cytochrome c [uncultured Aliiroseovarius sp.]|uniref:c-type cytochrome n=1 Tax=uncultured Aliiroseovarius sp. TaxID=1658783 RepID=UPI00261134D3|nr:cytochrome c [uncultured Aliiroseovarius sp.]
MTIKTWSLIGIAALIAIFLLTRGGANDGADPAAKIAAGAPMVTVQLPAELSAKAVMGKRAFDAVCADCHGTDAAGQQGIAPPLVHKIYEPSHHADMAFVLAAQRGVTAHHWGFGNMPPVDGLTRADVANIIAYVRELQRENGIN